MVSAIATATTTANNNGADAPPRERLRPPPPALVEAEQQWLFTDDDLNQTPSVLDGMTPEEERGLRRKGVHFIVQVGMMLKLPQTTLSVAAIFFHRYLVRNSLKSRPGYKPLHHYVSLLSIVGYDPKSLKPYQQVAATALFLATKVEENCRKMKELVVACVRVALKDPNKLVDEQTKDYWKWRDTILYSEDVLLESLCFDLSVEPPYQTMYQMLNYYRLEHNKPLRNAAWAFLADSSLTHLCLLFDSRTIAAASLYAAARHVDIEIPEDDGKPWWEVQYVQLRNIRRSCNLMADVYESSPPKDGQQNIYIGLRSPEEIDFDTPTPTQQPTSSNGAPPEEVLSEEGELDG
jgi:protein BUR2